MCTAIDLDPTSLWPEPLAVTGLTQKSALVHEALKALIERESARRLARLGGSESGLETVRRRRTKPVRS